MKDQNQLSFDYETYDQWLVDHTQSSFIEGTESKQWLQSIVKNIDYLVNPHITKYNFSILENLLQTYLPCLNNNETKQIEV